MSQVNQQIKDEIRQEMLEESYNKTSLYENPEYCVEYFNLQKLADSLKEALQHANKYGHNFKVSDFIID